MNLERKITKFGRIMLASSLMLIGCNKDNYVREGTFKGYEAEVHPKSNSYTVILRSKEKGSLAGIDHPDEDHRIDEIRLFNIPVGDSLERYANLDSLELAYKTLMEK